VRSALDWALRHQDRTDVLLRLAAAASPFLLDLSLLSEGARWASIGLGVVEGRRGSSQELELQASLGMSLLFSRGSLEEVQVALTRGLVLADERLDRYNQMRLIGALSNFHQRTGELERSLQLAERAKVVAQSLNDPVCSAMADWLMGTSSHLVGNHATARRVCERAWSSSSHSSLVKRVRFGFDDHRIRALCGWARSLWLLGQVDDARGAVPRVMQEAERFGHPIALSVALAWLTPVWFWTGEWHVAEEYAARLVAHAEQHSSAVYRAVGRGLQGELAVERGDASEGLLLLQDALNVLQHSRFSVLQAVYADPLARALARLGRFDEALAAIDGALQASERKGRSFALPELLRVKGSLLAEQARDTPVEAERLLRQAYELARQQGALSLQLRSAMSLATSNAIAPTESAQKLLRETYVQFSQGLETRDLILAGRWLDLSRSNAG
jgi:tetratricopeptide (TPR) repeat protein